MTLDDIQRLRERAGERLMHAMVQELAHNRPAQTATSEAAEWGAPHLTLADLMELLDLAEAGLRAGEEVLAEHSGSTHRAEYVTPWAWLFSGDRIVVLRGAT